MSCREEEREMKKSKMGGRPSGTQKTSCDNLHSLLGKCTNCWSGADLLSGEVLHNVTKLSMLAPSAGASTESIQTVIDRDDVYTDLSPVEVPAIEARRLLYLLLFDTRRSPFLYGIHHKSPKAEEQANTRLAQLSKALHSLLSSQGYGPSTKMLLGTCLKTTPALVPHFFRGLPPLCSNLTYKSLAALTFFEGVLREAPHPFQIRSLPTEDAVWSVVPSCITKTILSKVVQSQSALFVSSGLKLVATLLRRAQTCAHFLSMSAKERISKIAPSEEIQKSISQAVLKHVPEVSLLFSIPSRFDPFLEGIEAATTTRANALVVLQLCDVVQFYAKLDPSSMSDLKFDWIKLLPKKILQEQGRIRAFGCAEPLLQRRILCMLVNISQLSHTTFSLQMLPHVLSILVSTCIPEVYGVARRLAISLTERGLFSRVGSNPSLDSAEAWQCQCYEASLWVDGVGADTIQDFVARMNDARRRRVQHKIALTQARAGAAARDAVLPRGVSPLLSSLIGELLVAKHVSSSDGLARLAIQIATRIQCAAPYSGCPVKSRQSGRFQDHPMPLLDPQNSGVGCVAVLSRLAKTTFCDDLEASAGVESLYSTAFLTGCGLVDVVKATSIKKTDKRTQLILSDCTSPVTFKQCLNICKDLGWKNKELLSLVRRCIICILETKGNLSSVVSMLIEMFKLYQFKSAEKESSVILLLSSTRSSLRHLDAKVKALLNHYDNTNQESVGMLVASELLRCSLVLDGIEAGTFFASIGRYSSDFVAHTSLSNFLLTVLLHTIPDREHSKNSSPFPPGMLFDLWVLLAENLFTELEVKCCLRLEDHLAALFGAGDSQIPWTLYQCVCTLTPQGFVNLCIKTLVKREKPCNDNTPPLLSTVLQYDCSNFSCLTSMFTNIDADSRMSELWHCGSLDSIATAFVLQTSKQLGTSKITAEVASIIGRRFLILINQKDQRKLGAILDVLKVLCHNQSTLLDVQKSICEVFDHLTNRSRVLDINDELQLMNLSVTVGSSLKNQGSNDSLLLSKAFVRCCKLLPRHIKNMLRTKRDSEIFLVECLVDTFSSLIEKSPLFDDQSAPAINNCIVSCLKYGIMNSQDFASCSPFGGCIKVIRLIMVKAHSPESTMSVEILKPFQVHAMAVAHSSFKCALSGNNKSSRTTTLNSNGDKLELCNALTQQLELIRLLLCTISLDTNVQVEKETFNALLSVYNASTNSVDQLLRRLMFLYWQSQKDVVLMNDLRWRHLGTHYDQRKIDQCNLGKETWDWLVDGLEIDRIKLTLAQFPVRDTLDPIHSDCEFMTDFKGEMRTSDQLSLMEPEDEVGDDVSVSEAELSVTPQANSPLLDAESDLWRGDGDDLRYSPGFILPLILATLEAYLPGEEIDRQISSNSNSSYKNDRNNTQCQAFGGVCRRLCDRGGISLAIASLSSRCRSIRKVAVAVCGLFIRALKMKESHGIKSWRERPQLEMIMSSIQRGLTVRRAIQIRKHDMQEGVDFGGMAAATHKQNIPLLPAVSAVFLSKALLILSNPRDDMYGQINRYFLRQTDYHGALTDFFGLPGFLPLYCSTSVDLSRCRSERAWALLTLKDSTVDRFSYRIVSQHHVPELLMSSFDSLIGNPENENELYLTINVIETFLQSGGTYASNHLINRQGLLSWLHGILSWRNSLSVFPSAALKCRFLKLITTSVNCFKRINTETDSDDADVLTFYEQVPLANTVIRICLDRAGTNKIQDDLSHESATVLLEHTCNALWAIYLAGNGSHLALMPQGLTTLHDAMSLLQKAVSLSFFMKLLTSVCNLPLVSTDADLSSVKLFCELTLGFLLEMRTRAPSDTVLVSLERVTELMRIYPLLGDNRKFRQQVMECRHVAVMAGGIQIWNRFLPFLDSRPP